jgi:hypothetical protein
MPAASGTGAARTACTSRGHTFSACAHTAVVPTRATKQKRLCSSASRTAHPVASTLLLDAQNNCAVAVLQPLGSRKQAEKARQTFPGLTRAIGCKRYKKSRVSRPGFYRIKNLPGRFSVRTFCEQILQSRSGRCIAEVGKRAQELRSLRDLLPNRFCSS